MPRQRRQPKSKKRSRTAPEEGEGWWTIKGIVNERKLTKGKTEYLVDWEGEDPSTGKPYPSSWTEWVTPDILKDWEDQKRKPTEPVPSTAPTHDSNGDIQPSNSQRSLQRTNENPVSCPRSNASDPQEGPKKVRRLQIQDRPSEEPPSSIFSAGTGDFENQTPASLHFEELSHLGDQTLAIELNKPSQFDPAEYQSITNSEKGSQLVSELEEEDQTTILASELSRQTIPDSQDPSSRTLPESLPIEAPNIAQIPSSQSSSSAETIPDSQDHSLNCPILTTTSQSINSEPAQQDASFQRESVPNSNVAKSDIPSRQLEQSRPRSSDSPPLSTGVLSSLSTNRSIPRAPTASSFEKSTSTSIPRESILLTQPLNQPGLPAPTSSLPVRLEADAVQGSQTQSSASHLTHSHPLKRNTPWFSPSQSQAAQHVARDFDTFPEITTSSGNTESNPVPRSENRPASVSGTAPPQPDKEYRQLVLDRVPTIAEILKPGFRFPSFRVKKQAGTAADMEESSGSAQRSAVDELKSLFNFGDAILPTEDYGLTSDSPLQDNSGPPPEQSSAGPTVASNLETTPENAVHSPEAEVLSQPPPRVEPWKPEVMGNSNQDMPPPSISPASIMHNPSVSAVNTLKNIVDMVFDGSNAISDLPQGTISPADISCSVGPGEATYTLMMPLSDRSVVPSGFDESSEQSITMGQSTQHEYVGSTSSSEGDVVPSEHVVTLPFQASRRPYYDDTLLEYKREAEEFGDIFNSEVYKEPNERLVKRIEELFGRLFNICDYPQDLVGTRLEDLSANQQAKYSNDANPKFNFMYELLDAISREKEILVLARTPELLRLLHAQTETLGLESVCHGFEKPHSSLKNSATRITLALSSEDFDPFKFDVIIGFDHTFSHSPVSRRLTSGSSNDKAPLVLHLVTTHSIEHIYLHIPQDISPPERMNALLSGIVRARSLIEDPDTGYPEPHEIAVMFSKYLNGLTENISWEPQSIPDNVLDFFLAAQSLSQAREEHRMSRGNGLKRKLDVEQDSDDTKRMRMLPVLEPIVEFNDPPLPYPIRALLKSAQPKGDAKETMSRISVPLVVLEGLAQQVAEYKRKPTANDIEAEYKATINRLEKQVREYQRTTTKTEESLRQALQDRSSFEKAKLKTEEAKQTAKDAAQKESDKHQKRISELEATVARLVATPEATEEESPLARTEKLLEEAQKKVKTLEKRLENAQNETDYIRSIYQNVNSNASVLAAEIKTLREQNEDLQLRASENLKHIHQIQANATKDIYLNTIAELKTLIREQEYELGRLREERTFRNGRSSMRQTSVPRSPRMGMMSPRPGRGFGSASRGTSPVPGPGHDGSGPGTQFMGQQPGNGRFGSHLRD